MPFNIKVYLYIKKKKKTTHFCWGQLKWLCCKYLFNCYFPHKIRIKMCCITIWFFFYEKNEDIPIRKILLRPLKDPNWILYTVRCKYSCDCLIKVATIIPRCTFEFRKSNESTISAVVERLMRYIQKNMIFNVYFICIKKGEIWNYENKYWNSTKNSHFASIDFL